MTVFSPIALSAACLVSVGALLVAEHLGSTIGRIVFKLAASSCFVLVALAVGAQHSSYGQWILAALLLGWLGDALLLSAKERNFMAGLAAFLLSHLLFAAAFLSAGTSGTAMSVAAIAAGVVSFAVLRWLLPCTPVAMKAPVLAYVVVILAMCVAATGYAAASGRWWVLAGALLFAASDIAVARERFVKQSFMNQLWGLPTYFMAQLLLAWSAHTHASVA